LPVTSPIASSQNADKLRSQPDIAKLKLAILQFLQPGVLPVLALALVVGGWSYGLKLSHYLHHTDVTKASTTRMWVDHRNDTSVAPDQHHQSPQKFLTLQLHVFAVPPLPSFSREGAIAESVPAYTVEFVSPLHPLRAPPISHLA
jgi:hypothetical protein